MSHNFTKMKKKGSHFWEHFTYQTSSSRFAHKFMSPTNSEEQFNMLRRYHFDLTHIVKGRVIQKMKLSSGDKSAEIALDTSLIIVVINIYTFSTQIVDSTSILYVPPCLSHFIFFAVVSSSILFLFVSSLSA